MEMNDMDEMLIYLEVVDNMLRCGYGLTCILFVCDL